MKVSEKWKELESRKENDEQWRQLLEDVRALAEQTQIEKKAEEKDEEESYGLRHWDIVDNSLMLQFSDSDWENSITVSIGVNDIRSILSRVTYGR